MYEMEAAFWQYCWTKDSFSTLVTGLFILFPSCSSPHRFCRRLSDQLCASKAHDEKKVLWHIRFDLKRSIRCQDWAISASSKTLPVMILLNLRESGSPPRPTALPSRSRITDFSVIVQGCCVRVRAAAQVQDSRQVRVASLKEVSLNLQDCGGRRKKHQGKKTVYWIPSQGQDKSLVLRQSWLGRHIRGRPPRKSPKSFSRSAKRNKIK